MRFFCMKKYVLNQTFFLALHSTKIHFVRLYQSYVVWILVHACVWSTITIFISSFWIVFISFVSWNRSYQNHQTKIFEYDWRYKNFWMLMQHVINLCWSFLIFECISNMFFCFRNMLIIIDFAESSDFYKT